MVIDLDRGRFTCNPHVKSIESIGIHQALASARTCTWVYLADSGEGGSGSNVIQMQILMLGPSKNAA